MNTKKENDILEATLSIAENGYAEAYRFLVDAYEKDAGSFGPQALYFLACLAGGADMPEKALAWIRKAVADNGWWYRPEVLEDGDLEPIKDNAEFIALKAVSDGRYADAAAKAEEVFSWEGKKTEKLLLAVHGNTQNGQTARNDWEPLLGENSQWQTETIQSAEPDGYGTYRWSYDMVSYQPVARALQMIQSAGYKQIACGGFSAGCDMLLRTVLFTPARCDMLILQSPWIPLLHENAGQLIDAIGQKGIALNIFCGSEDADCLPMAEQLYALAAKNGLNVRLDIQKDYRHQFPDGPSALADLLRGM